MWRLWTFTCLQRISSKIEGPMFLAGGFNMSSSHSVILNGNNYLKFDQNRNYLKTDGSHQCRVSTRMMIRQIWNYQGTHLLDFFLQDNEACCQTHWPASDQLVSVLAGCGSLPTWNIRISGLMSSPKFGFHELVGLPLPDGQHDICVLSKSNERLFMTPAVKLL